LSVAGTAAIGNQNSAGSGFTMSISSDNAKATTADNPILMLSTKDTLASNPFNLALGLYGNTTASLRYAYLNANDFGTGNYYNLALNPYGGNVGIGTAGPDDKFVVYNGSTTGRYTTSGWTHTSDIRLKKNIRPLEGSLEKVLQLNGIRFDFKAEKGDKSGHIGFIAQDVEKVFPEIVTTGSDGYKSIAYANLAPVLVEAIKSLKKENDALKETIKGQDNRLQKQEKDIAYLKQELVGATAMQLKAAETLATQTEQLKTQTKEIQDIKTEVGSAVSASLLEEIKTQTQEIEGLKAEIASLKGKL
jgi:Skp family chaperone for outer membrane proteins